MENMRIHKSTLQPLESQQCLIAVYPWTVLPGRQEVNLLLGPRLCHHVILIKNITVKHHYVSTIIQMNKNVVTGF